MQKRKGKHSNKNTDNINTYNSVSNFITQLVSSFGWPGTLFVCIMSILLTWPSAAQKNEFINIYFLLKWEGNYLYAVLPVTIFILAFIAQNRIYSYKYKKKLELKEEELKRVSKERTRLQEILSEKGLHHSVEYQKGKQL